MLLRARAAVCAAVASLATVAATPAVADPAHDVAVYCEYTRTAAGIAYVAVARVPEGHEPLVSVSLSCTFSTGEMSIVASTAAPAPVVGIASTGVLLGGPVTVCETATAVFQDGHVSTVPTRCDAVRSPIPLPASDLRAPTGTCASHRQAGQWVLASEGVAAVRSVPALATSVTCTLTDTQGNKPRVQLETSGGTSTVAGALTGYPFLPLTSRCVDVRAAYADGYVASGSQCETW